MGTRTEHAPGTFSYVDGGQVHAGPIPFPQGRIAVCADPQGAFFSLWEGQLES